MRGCRDIRTKILKTGAAEGRAVAGHLAACPGCSRWLEELHLADSVLKRVPAPQVPADFESRMQKAIEREAATIPDAAAAAQRPPPASARPPLDPERPWVDHEWIRPRYWIPAFAAAAIVVVIAVSLYFGKSRPAAVLSEFGVAMTVALNATESILGADISLSLPSGIDLAGAERNGTGRNLTWRQDLAAGRTDLSVGLVAFAHGDHRVAVKVCKELECAAGTVIVHAGPEGVRMTWMKAAARGPVRFAFTVGAKQETEGPEISISTQEDRS